jgi:hypothetical protein
MGALGSDVASVMAVVAASGVVVDEGGLVLQLVKAGSRAEGETDCHSKLHRLPT